MLPQEEVSHAVAAISTRQRTILSQILQDLRQTLSHMRLPKVSALSALDATAIDALKDLYYLANTEDPLNTMPIRRHILQTNIAPTLLLPLLTLLHSDPAAKTSPKRWSVPIYHSLRLFSVLTSPVLRENGLLPLASSLDDTLLNLRAKLANTHSVIDAYVALLQYYLDRKARKTAALAAAEESKLEDARIDNILRFFRNLLSPPRTTAGEHLQIADRGVHFAVVKALVKTDFYSTLSILFASKEDARGQYTDLVFLIAEIYALTFRHSTPKQVYQASRRSTSEKVRVKRGDVLSVQQDIRKRRSAGLRAALQRERAVIGGSRAIRASARWMSRHSGGFTAAPKEGATTNTKKIISAQTAIQSNLIFNPKRPLQEAIHVNSEILCLLTAKGRSKSGIVHKKLAAPIKQDVVEDGLRGIVTLTTEMVEVCFEYFVRELRERIEETKQRSKADETETLMTAQKSFVAIVGAVVGFHRERFGKILRDTTENLPSLTAQLHDNCMKAVLSSDSKIIKGEWKAVEAGIELETFQLVFRVLVESCESLRENGKDDEKVQIVEVSTSAVLEMMKMLQGMTANSDDDNDEQGDQDTDKKLTPREIALNTLEHLFERQSFLNAPAELAKDFNTKMFSFRHLTNIVEVAHAFTTILLDEQELARLQVTRRKRSKAKKQKDEEKKNDEDSDPEFQIGQNDAQKNEEEGAQDNKREEDGQEQRVKKKNKIVESDEEEEEENTTTGEKASVLDTDKPSDEDDSLHIKEQDGAAPGNEVVRPIPNSEAKEPAEAPNSTEHETEMEKELLADADDETEEHQKDTTTSADKPAKELSKIEQMLLADAAHEPQNPSAKLQESQNEEWKVKDQSEKQPLSKVKLMLMADQEREPEKQENGEKPDPSKLTAVQSMLLADANEEGKETEMPQLVSTIEEMRREANKEKIKADGAVENDASPNADGNDDGSDDSEEEPELREIESIGIIRRFAQAKALQTLVLPVRAALCEAASLSGMAHPIPEGSSPLLSPIVIAKSAHVLAAIWRVAKIRERGVQCGQFFSYSTMHLMSIALAATKQNSVRKDSVLERFSVFAKDVTKEFFSWLAINPGLSLDMLFPMDKNSCSMYVSYMRQKQLADSRQAIEEESGNESDMSLLEIEKRVDNAAVNGAERPRTSNRSRNATSRAGTRRMRERRRAEREKIEEDEDVDDIDNLDLGIDEGDGEISADDSPKKPRKAPKMTELPDDFIEDSPVGRRSRKAKRTRKQSFDPFDSDDEHLQSRMRKKRAIKAKKLAKKVKESAAKKARGGKKPTFSSSDEYSDIEIESGMEISDEEKEKTTGPGADKDAAESTTEVERNRGDAERPTRRAKERLNFSESPDMLDEEEDDGEEEEPVRTPRKSASKASGRKPDRRVLATRTPDAPPSAAHHTNFSESPDMLDEEEDVEEDEEVVGRPRNSTSRASKSKLERRVLATRAPDSPPSNTHIHTNEEDGHSAAESDAKTSAGIPTPASEKSKSVIGDISPIQAREQPLVKESETLPLASESDVRLKRGDRKPRRVVVSDDESD